jgi:hypothetical protein
VSQDRKGGTLERFVHGLVTEEFDGPEPPPAVVRGLADYVRALSPEACGPAPERPLTAQTRFDDARRGVNAALAALDAGDRPTAALMLGSARTALGRIHERYADPSLAVSRRLLETADLDLAAARSAVLRKAPGARDDLLRWLARLEPVRRRVVADEPRSLFEPARLAAAETPRLAPH